MTVEAPRRTLTISRVRNAVAIASHIAAFTLLAGVFAGVAWCWLGTLYAVSFELRDE